MQANVFQVLKAARAERRLRFTSAIFHHLSAIKIQRALRAHWALESAKRQIHSVITIQVESQNIHSATSIEEYNSFYKWHLDFFFYFIFFLKRLVRARQQRRRYLEYKLKVATAQRAVRHWLARRHKAATVIQQAVWKFLLLRRQKRVQQGILKAQVP